MLLGKDLQTRVWSAPLWGSLWTLASLSLSTSILGPLADSPEALHIHLRDPRGLADSRAIPATDLSLCPLHPLATRSCPHPHPNTSQMKLRDNSMSTAAIGQVLILSHVPSCISPLISLSNPQRLLAQGQMQSHPFPSVLRPAGFPDHVPYSLCACDCCPAALPMAPHWACALVCICLSSPICTPGHCLAQESRWAVSYVHAPPPSHCQECRPEQVCH